MYNFNILRKQPQGLTVITFFQSSKALCEYVSEIWVTKQLLLENLITDYKLITDY